MRRLPGQLEGIGYIVEVDLDWNYREKIRELLELGLHGGCEAEVAERLFVNEWLEHLAPEFCSLGITEREANLRGYFPVRFLEQGDELREAEETLKFPVYGIPAFQLDRLVEARLYGASHSEVARLGIERVLDRREQNTRVI